MTLVLHCPDEAAPVPKPVQLILTCDGSHGLLEGFRAVFEQDGYIANRKAASAAGWRFAGDGKVFGPCCSKRKVAEE